MKKQKQGFTLIELLVVITILGMVAVIIVPEMMKTINKSSEKTFLNSARNLMHAADIAQKNYMFEEGIEDIEFYYSEGVESSNIPNLKLDYSGEKPQSGKIIINKRGEIALAIHDGNYCAEKWYSDKEVKISTKAKEECEISFPCGSVVVDDRDNNTYKTVKIGEQCWFAENLRYTGNGCLIKEWNNGSTHDACKKHDSIPAWATENTNEVLYQWVAAMNGNETAGSQGICPDGWHIPTDAEWTTLTNYVGSNPGTKLKSSTNWDGTDDYGFNAFPAGRRDATGTLLLNVGSEGSWWTSSSSLVNAWRRLMISSNSSIVRMDLSKNLGHSVLCVLNDNN